MGTRSNGKFIWALGFRVQGLEFRYLGLAVRPCWETSVYEGELKAGVGLGFWSWAYGFGFGMRGVGP